MKLSAQLYFILFKITAAPGQDSVALSKQETLSVENGLAVANLVRAIEKTKQLERAMTPLTKLDQMKALSTQSAKLFNWNSIIECLNLLQVKHNISADLKQHVIMGDQQIITELVEEIYGEYLKLLQRPSSGRRRIASVDRATPLRKSSQHINSQKSYRIRNYSMHDDSNLANSSLVNASQVQRPAKQQVDLANVSKEAANAGSALEFLLSILQNRLQLTSKQAAALFADNNKYLAHVIAKGVQGLYEPIIEFYQDVLKTMPRLVQVSDPKSLVFSLQALKLGLISKSQEVAALAISAILGLRQEVADHGYIWFTQQGGLQIVMLSLRRHPQLTDQLAQVVVDYTRMHFQELFTQTLPQAIPVEWERLSFITSVFESLIKSSQIREELSQLGIVSQWIDAVLQPEKENDGRIVNMKLSCLLWRHYPEKINETYLIKYLQLHRSLVKTSQLNVGLFAIQLVCSLLTHLCNLKHEHAPSIYKNLAIILVENFDRQDIRAFLLSNIEHLFSMLPSIPVSVILEPTIKQAQTLQYPCLQVLKFINAVTQKPLPLKSMVQLLDLLAKISLSDVMFYRITQHLMIRVLDRGLASELSALSIEEFTVKYAKVALSIYFSSLKSQRAQKSVLEAQKRAQVIDILKSIIQLQSVDLNIRLKLLIGQTYQQIKDLTRQPNKAMNTLLKLFGNPDQILREIEQDLKAEETTSVIQESMVNRSISNGTRRVDPLKKSTKPPNPKVVAEIEDIKRSFVQKQQQQNEQAERQNANLARQKAMLRKQLEKRSIEQGVATKNQKDVETNLIFADGTREKELQIEKKNGLPNIEVVDLNEEEERDRILVELLLQRSNKALRWLFTKFANSGFNTNNPSSFDHMLKQNGTINVAELRKMLQEFELDTHITKEEILFLAREVHVKLLNERTELKSFDFAGFQHFFVQLALILALRPPYSAKHTPPFQCFQQLLRHIRTITAARKQSTALFDDPDSQYFSQSELIKEFNKQLQLNPDYILPDGYKKVNVPDISFSFSLVPKLKIKSKHQVCYEIMSDLVEKLWSSPIEPITVKTNNFKARPNTFGYIQSKITDAKKPDLYESPLKRNQSAPKQQVAVPKRRVLEIEPKREFSIGLKMALSKYNFKELAIVEQVANLIDDLVYAVENNRPTLDRQLHIQNKTQERKIQLTQQQQKLEELRERRRKDRQSQLKEQLVTDRKANEEKLTKMKEQQKQKNEELKKLESQKQQQKKEYLDEQKKHIKSKQDQQQQQFLKSQEEVKQKRIEELSKKKKEFVQFNKKQIQQFKEDMKAEKSEKAKAQAKKEQQEQKRTERLDEIRQGYKAQDAMRIQIERGIHQKLVDRFVSPEYQTIFSTFQFQLTQLFEFLVKETFYPIGQPASREQITIKTFTWFADRFKLWPEILTKYDLITVFRALTRDKVMVDHVPVGMNFNEFSAAMHRLSIKGKHVFNLMRGATAKEAEDIVARNKRPDEESQHGDEEIDQPKRRSDQTDDNDEPQEDKKTTLPKKQDVQEASGAKLAKNDDEDVGNKTSSKSNLKQGSLEEEANKKSASQKSIKDNVDDEDDKQAKPNPKADELGTNVDATPKKSQDQQGVAPKQQQRSNAKAPPNNQTSTLSKAKASIPNNPKKADSQLKDSKIGTDNTQLQLPADQLIDNYGNIDEANPDTLVSMIVYLNLPADKIKLEMRFRQILEEGKQPTRRRKEELTRRLQA